MASSSGNSSGYTQFQNSGYEEVMDQRKRKRMQSNRESARRSRMRKQKHLAELTAQLAQLKKQNSEIHTRANITTQHYVNVEAENTVLRAQIVELTQRLESLNDILGYMDTANGTVFCEHQGIVNNQYWDLMHLGQPIMASADMFQY